MASKPANESVKRDHSLARGKDEKGNHQPAQPDPNEQSGSAGRRTGSDADRGKDSGQGRYGQSGLGGAQHRETDGQSNYRRSGPDGGKLPRTGSNPGSGSSDTKPEDEQLKKKP
jgi:hypothetical protein